MLIMMVVAATADNASLAATAATPSDNGESPVLSGGHELA